MKPKIQEGNFCEMLKSVIDEGRHVDYIQEAQRKYKEYKRKFQDNFTDKNPSDGIYEFRVNYLLKKPVWRKIEILGKQTFDELAEIIISSMGWDNDHMHGFEFLEDKRPDPYYTGSSFAFFAPGWEDDPHPTFKSDEIHICDIDYIKQPKLNFIFDFGDGHRFDIEFKGSRKIRKNEGCDKFPCIADQRGVGPEQYPSYD